MVTMLNLQFYQGSKKLFDQQHPIEVQPGTVLEKLERDKTIQLLNQLSKQECDAYKLILV